MSTAAAIHPRPGRATAMLVLCCLCWGASFPLMPIAVSGLARAAGPIASELGLGASVNAWRYTLAALVLGLAVLPRWRHLTRSELLGGVALGGCMGAGMLGQILGLAWVLPSTSGMLSATPVVFAPLAQAWLLRRPVSRRLLLAAALAAIGCALLPLGGSGARTSGSLISTPPFTGAGEAVTLAAALCFTAMILLIDRFGAVGADAARLSGVMFATVAALNAGVAAVAGGGLVAGTSLIGDATWLGAMAVLALVCTVAALWLMTRAQPALPPARAAVIYTLEPIFGTGFSLLLGQELLTAWTVAGGGLVVIAAVSATRGPAPSPPSRVGPSRSAGRCGSHGWDP